MSYEVHVKDVENNTIPRFMVDWWISKHGIDPVKYLNHKVTIMSVDVVPVTFFIAILVLIASFLLLSWLGLMVGVVLFAVFCFFEEHETKESKTAKRFYTQATSLFGLLDIKPNTEIGKMSKEEFRACVEGSLKDKAKWVDCAEGFIKAKRRTEFNNLHAICLEWELCHREHAVYYPKTK